MSRAGPGLSRRPEPMHPSNNQNKYWARKYNFVKQTVPGRTNVTFSWFYCRIEFICSQMQQKIIQIWPKYSGQLLTSRKKTGSEKTRQKVWKQRWTSSFIGVWPLCKHWGYNRIFCRNILWELMGEKLTQKTDLPNIKSSRPLTVALNKIRKGTKNIGTLITLFIQHSNHPFFFLHNLPCDATAEDRETWKQHYIRVPQSSAFPSYLAPRFLTTERQLAPHPVLLNIKPGYYCTSKSVYKMQQTNKTL